MNAVVDIVYNKSPVFLQNLLVSLYGIKLYRERYNRLSKYWENNLKLTEKYQYEQITELQRQRFVRIAHIAIGHVPFYRDWANSQGIKKSDILSLNDLKKFPILEKLDIRKDPKKFVDDRYINSSSLFKLETSGTTGTPLIIYSNKNVRTHHYAFWTRLRSWFGLDRRSRRATFFGRIIQSPDNNTPPFWRYDVAQKNLLFSSYHLSSDNLALYYQKLVDYCPKEIIGYPSSLFSIAKYIYTNNLQPLKPNVVFTTAETLLPQQRQLLEKSFDAPVIDQYGCTEMALFVSQCEKGGMHIHPEHGIVEVIDADGNPLAAGVEGEVVCTGLINDLMPLIRYRLGDRLTKSSSECTCGRAFPLVEDIGGRVDDILLTPDGRKLARMDPIFKGQTGIFESQIIQHSLELIEFYLVVEHDLFDVAARNNLITEIRKRVGNEMKIKLSIVDSIAKNSNGKFKSVVSKL